MIGSLAGGMVCAINVCYAVWAFTKAVDCRIRAALFVGNVAFAAWGPFILDLRLPEMLLLWIPLLSALFAIAWPKQKLLPHQCKCGYDLTGNVSGRCPECGNTSRST